MKKIIIAMMMLALVLNAKEKLLPELKAVVEASDLDTNLLAEWVKGAHSDIAIHFKEGSVIPCRFLIRQNCFVARLDPSLTMTVEKECYFRMFNRRGYISYDLSSWVKADAFLHGKQESQLKIDRRGALVVEQTITPYTQEDLAE